MAQTHRFYGRRTGPADWRTTSDFVDTVPVVHPAEALRHVRSDLPHDECTYVVCQDIDELDARGRSFGRVIAITALAVMCAIFLAALPGCGGGGDASPQHGRSTTYSSAVAGPLSTGYAGRVSAFDLTPEVSGVADVEVTYTITGMSSPDVGWVGAWSGRSFDTLPDLINAPAQMAAATGAQAYTARATYRLAGGRPVTLRLFAGYAGTAVTDVHWAVTVEADQ